MQTEKLIRIAPAFDNPVSVLEMFERHAPYQTMAGYMPVETREGASLPWFRAIGRQMASRSWRVRK